MISQLKKVWVDSHEICSTDFTKVTLKHNCDKVAPRYRRKNPANHLRVHFTFIWVQSHMILILQTNVKLKLMRPHASKIPANIWPGYENTFLSSLTFTSVCLQWIYCNFWFLLLQWMFSISPLNLTNEFFSYAVLAFWSELNLGEAFSLVTVVRFSIPLW